MGALAKGWKKSESEVVSAHFQYLKSLVEEGAVLLAGRTTNTDNSSFGIIIFETGSETEAEDLVASDPAVKNRVFRAELFPFSLALLAESKRPR
jgi:uncharacterized protein YciI